jgi:phosphomannomutase
MVTWKVGRAYAAHKLREVDGIFGGELAGHYYFKDFFYSDSGIMASLIILGIVSGMKKNGITLSKLISRIEKYKNSGEINFKIEQKQKAMDRVRDYFISVEEPVAYYDFDGYRVEFPRWWFNIRPSNTEPYLRFIAEASTEELLESKVSKVRELLKDL